MFLSIAGERTSNDALVENDPAILHVRGLFSSYEYIKENFFFWFRKGESDARNRYGYPPGKIPCEPEDIGKDDQGEALILPVRLSQVRFEYSGLYSVWLI